MADEPKTRPLKGWWTLLFNVLVLLTTAFSYLLADSGSAVKELLSNPEHATIAISVISMVNVALRALTSTSIGRKE